MVKDNKSSEYFKSVLGNGLTKDGKSFDYLIKEKPAFVKFYSKYCGHCSNMAPEWNALDGDENIGNIGIYIIEVDVDGMDKIKSECKNGANVGVPYMTMVNTNGDSTKDYNGERTKDSMKKFILENGKNLSSSKKKVGGFKKIKSKSRKYTKNIDTNKMVKKSSMSSKKTKKYIKPKSKTMSRKTKRRNK